MEPSQQIRNKTKTKKRKWYHSSESNHWVGSCHSGRQYQDCQTYSSINPALRYCLPLINIANVIVYSISYHNKIEAKHKNDNIKWNNIYTSTCCSSTSLPRIPKEKMYWEHKYRLMGNEKNKEISTAPVERQIQKERTMFMFLFKFISTIEMLYSPC